MNIRKTHLVLISIVLLSLLTPGAAGAANVFTDRDLKRYERGQPGAAVGDKPGQSPETLWPGIETWLDLNEIENQIEQTIGNRDRRIDELIRQMEAEMTQCTGIVGAEYWSGDSAHGYLVNATAKKNCELLVERKYDTAIRDTRQAAEERLQQLSSRKRELEARQRSLK